MDNYEVQKILQKLEELSNEIEDIKKQVAPFIAQNEKEENESKQEDIKKEAKVFNDVIITTTALHVRELPNTDCPIIGRLTNGEVVRPIDKDGDWYKIRFEGCDGWISSKFTAPDSDDDIRIEKINFKIGRPYNAVSPETIKLREIINDEFGGGYKSWELQCTEYTQYRITMDGKRIIWPVTRGRHGGKWAKIFSNNEKYNVSDKPTKGTAMSFTKIKGYGHVAYVEEVLEDGSIKISEANWPKSGTYQERTISKKMQEDYGAKFINFI